MLVIGLDVEALACNPRGTATGSVLSTATTRRSNEESQEPIRATTVTFGESVDVDGIDSPETTTPFTSTPDSIRYPLPKALNAI